MADKTLALKVGELASLIIKATFEGVAVPSKVTINEEASDLKGLVTIGALVPDADAGTISIPFTGSAVGAQDATIVFDYADAGSHADVENWGKSTKTVGLTVTAADAEVRLEDVSTPLSMDLWQSKPLTFRVMKGDNDIAPSITSVTVDQASLDDAFEFSSVDGVYSFKSILANETQVVTATAKVTIAGTDGGVAYSLETDVVLNTNINDGGIPINRFDVEFM